MTSKCCITLKKGLHNIGAAAATSTFFNGGDSRRSAASITVGILRLKRFLQAIAIRAGLVTITGFVAKLHFDVTWIVFFFQF